MKTCTDPDCVDPAIYRAHLPGQDWEFCEEHLAKAKAMTVIMGVDFPVRIILDRSETDWSRTPAREDWLRKLLELVDDFQFIDTESTKDERIRAALAHLLQATLANNAFPLKETIEPKPSESLRRCEQYPECDCEIIEACAPNGTLCGFCRAQKCTCL